jgi:hypothetical protein
MKKYLSPIILVAILLLIISVGIVNAEGEKAKNPNQIKHEEERATRDAERATARLENEKSRAILRLENTINRIEAKQEQQERLAQVLANRSLPEQSNGKALGLNKSANLNSNSQSDKPERKSHELTTDEATALLAELNALKAKISADTTLTDIKADSKALRELLANSKK